MNNKILSFFRKHWILILILLVSLIIRVVFALGNDKSLFVDIDSYDRFGFHLASQGNIWGSAYHAPGYVFFLALIYSIFGHSFINVYIAQCVLGVASTLLIYLIAKNIFNERIAVLSTFLSLLYWPFNLYSGILLSEVLFLFLLLLGTFTFLKALDTDKVLFIAAAAICFSLSTLTRSINLLFLIFIPCLYIFLKFKKKSFPQVLKNSLVFVAVFCAVLAPWIVRNYLTMKAFVPVDNLSGINLYIGNNPRADGLFMDITKDPLYKPEGSSLENDRNLKKAGVKYIIENPVKFIQLTLKRAYLFIIFDAKELDWTNYFYLREHPLLKESSHFLQIVDFMLVCNSCLLAGCIWSRRTGQEYEGFYFSRTHILLFCPYIIFLHTGQIQAPHYPLSCNRRSPFYR